MSMQRVKKKGGGPATTAATTQKKETTAEWERWILGSSKERRYINISEHYS